MSEFDHLPLFAQTETPLALNLANVAAAVKQGILKPVRIIDGKVRGTVEEPRLQSQCGKILERLRRGPATNAELAEISLKYTGRISDLRQSGHNIVVSERDRATGVTTYRLTPKEPV
jgi:hypothetical protein